MGKKDDNNNVIWHHATITREHRADQNGHKGVILWFTGLPCSGKSTLSHAVEERLHKLGCRTFVLDGDNVRHGLCSDIGFSVKDRVENIRRVGELAKLLLEAGLITMTAFISPFIADRERCRGFVPHGDFLEIYCDSPLEVCEKRDVKGMYKLARAGEIKEYTGISSPYEEPKKPELVVNTDKLSLEESVEEVLSLLVKRGVISSTAIDVKKC